MLLVPQLSWVVWMRAREDAGSINNHETPLLRACLRSGRAVGEFHPSVRWWCDRWQRHGLRHRLFRGHCAMGERYDGASLVLLLNVYCVFDLLELLSCTVALCSVETEGQKDNKWDLHSRFSEQFFNLCKLGKIGCASSRPHQSEYPSKN